MEFKSRYLRPTNKRGRPDHRLWFIRNIFANENTGSVAGAHLREPGDKKTHGEHAAAGYPNPCGRLAEQQEVADLVLFLRSPRADFITGQNIRIDGGTVNYI